MPMALGLPTGVLVCCNVVVGEIVWGRSALKIQTERGARATSDLAPHHDIWASSVLT